IEAAKGFLGVLRHYLDSLCSNLRSHTITNVQSNDDKVSLLLKESFIESFPSRERSFMKFGPFGFWLRNLEKERGRQAGTTSRRGEGEGAGGAITYYACRRLPLWRWWLGSGPAPPPISYLSLPRIERGGDRGAVEALILAITSTKEVFGE
ncbi:hypothetical protein CRG98_005950, partial [Punica granatum]